MTTVRKLTNSAVHVKLIYTDDQEYNIRNVTDLTLPDLTDGMQGKCVVVESESNKRIGCVEQCKEITTIVDVEHLAGLEVTETTHGGYKSTTVINIKGRLHVYPPNVR